MIIRPSQAVRMVRDLPDNAGDKGSIPALGRSAGGERGRAFYYLCLEDSVGRRVCWATVHGVIRRWTRLQQFSMHTCIVIIASIFLKNNFRFF